MITKSTDTQDMTRRRIALIAHDHKKQDLRERARFNRSLLTAHHLFATGTTGRLLGDELGLSVTCFQSGPLGGDQQIGSRIADGEIDLLIFFWDPLEPGGRPAASAGIAATLPPAGAGPGAPRPL
jgi:methylglyoxal synthase